MTSGSSTSRSCSSSRATRRSGCGTSPTAAGPGATPSQLSDGRGRQERPAIALLPDGRPVVAWQAATGSAVEVLVWVSGGGAPTAVSLPGKVITPPNAADSRSARYPASLFPDLAVLPDAVVVSWQDNRNDPDPLWTGHLDPGGMTDNDPTGVVDGDTTPVEPKTDPDRWEPMVSVRRLDGTTLVLAHPRRTAGLTGPSATPPSAPQPTAPWPVPGTAG